MKKSVFVALLGAALWMPAISAQRIEGRKDAQQVRIRQGVRSGELTRREAGKLARKEARLKREIRRDRLDGGGLTRKERVKIDHKQDKLSREIVKEKHDRQDRK